MFNRFFSTSIALTVACLAFSQTAVPSQQSSGKDTLTAPTPVIKYSANAREYEIAGIRVVGSTMYEDYVLIGFSGLSVGQKIQVPGPEITNAVKKFWKQQHFSSVKILADKIEGNKVWLQIVVEQYPRVSKVNYTGLKKSFIDDVDPKIGIIKQNQMTPDLRDKAIDVIKKYLNDKGFRYADVEVVEKDDPSQKGFVTVDINVDPGSKINVHEVFVIGNQALTFNQVTGAMKKTNEPRLVNIFKSKKFVDNNFKDDKDLIVQRYNEKGYRDAAVVWDSIARYDSHSVDVYLKVDEGKKYYIRNISWVGNTIYPTEYLNMMLGIKPGTVYNAKLLDDRLMKNDDAISKLYTNNGYLFMNVDPVEVNTSNDSIDFEMRIAEGKRATLNNIIINGNDHVYEHVIRRELYVVPGQLYSEENLIRTIREMAQMGNFEQEKLQPDIQPDPDNGTVDVTWNLVSKSNDQLQFSAGWGQTGIVGSLGVKFSNFAIQNLFRPSTYHFVPEGEGQTFSVQWQTNASYYQSFSLSFMEPWLGGKRPNALSISAYYSIQSGVSNLYSNYLNSMYNSYMYGGYGYGGYGDQTDISYYANPDQYIHTLGFNISWGKRLQWPDDFFQLNVGVDYQHYALKNWNYFLMTNGTSNLASLNVVLSRNSIDNPIFTRSGSSFALSAQVTPPYSAFAPNKDYASMTDAQRYKWVEFYKLKFQSKIFVPLSNTNRTFVLMGRADYGFLGYYNKNLKSPFETFYMGGDGMTGYTTYGTETIGLRGYENGSLTPLAYNASTGQSYQAGYVYTRLGAELRYPLVLEGTTQIYALAFADAGNCWSDFKYFNPFELKRSAGVGVRIFLPMFGLLGIDWGYGFDKVNGSMQYSGSHFHFIIGQEF